MLFRREILASFNIDQENKLILANIYQHIGQQSKVLLQSYENIPQIMQIKSCIDIFQKVLYLVGIETKMDNYSTVLVDLFKFLCFYSLEEYEKMIEEEMNKDNDV